MTLETYILRYIDDGSSTPILIFDHLQKNVTYIPTNDIGIYAYVRFDGVDCESLDCFIQGSAVLIVKLEDLKF